LHPTVGFLVGWGYAFVEPLVAPLLFLIFGNVVASTLNQEFGWSYDTWWLVSVVAAAVVVFLLGWFGVRLSTGAGALLGLCELLARGAWGAGWVLVFLAVANSAIANSNAAANAATRTWFAMGRIRLLPRALAHVNHRWHVPDTAVAAQFVLGVVVAVWLGLQY